MKKVIKILIGLIISLLIIVWISSALNWKEVIVHFKSVNYIYFIPGTVLLIIQMLFRAIRWKYLINTEQNISLKLRFDGIMIANFVNFILPLRAGEFVRPLFLNKFAKLEFSALLMSVVIERLFDLSTVLAFFAILLLCSDLNISSTAQIAASGLLVLAIFLIVALTIAVLFPKTLIKLISISTSFLPEKIKQIIVKFTEQLIMAAKVLKDPKKFILNIFLSLAVWITTFIQLYVFGLMFGIQLSLWFGIAIGVMLALAVALPSAPGFIGVYQAGCLLAFNLFALSQEQALTYSILTHVHQYVLILAYGVYIMFVYGMKFSDFKQQELE